MRPDDLSEHAPGRAVLEHGIWTYDPDPLPPRIEPDHDLVRHHGDATYALGRLIQLDDWFDTPGVIIGPMIHREAAESSDLETITPVTIRDLYKEEAGESVGQSAKERRDYIEAVNFISAIREAIDRIEMGESTSIDLLLDLHRTLMSGVRGEDKHPGAMRDTLVGVDIHGTTLEDARFVPMAPAKIPYAFQALIEYISTGPHFASLVDIALIHYQFETIHPFRDGNGRIGRLLMLLVLYEWDLIPGPFLYPSAYFKVHRDRYYDLLLAVNREGAWREWIEFVLDGFERQAKEAYEVAKTLGELRDRYHEQYASSGPVIHEVIDYLIEVPYFSAPQAITATGRSQPAVNDAIDTLWEDGILLETTGHARNRRFLASEVLTIIDPKA